ncbi:MULTISPECIES: LysR family transcriptional regulator [Hyphomicrobiales]|jgi:DNA-binding transcriptional LysR family regulator|uniref:LysR family transcriptional regulator n=1 Tax=Hyphomicrobiales TaxID=356 RepID=UPI0003680456|nr:MULTISPECIES: LysR family transcriptional regulator [Phyllobacteriaceae]MCX8568755.1 LysR family transcriptional regulator [Aminobacter sp. MET-1]
MDNRAGEMEVFVRAVGLGSFSAAGRQLGLSPSAVSKLITRIEDRLGARLLVRSTRALQLTPEGEVYLERAGRILGEIEEAERVVTSGGSAVPRGPLRVSASVAFGASHIVPHMAEFLALYPGIELDLSLTDSVIDLYQERADVAIRSGKLRDSSLVARKILEIRRVVVASPAYLERHGTPQVPADLAAHNCLRFNFLANRDEWIFRDPETGENFAQRIGGNMLGNNGPTLRRLCLDGLGLIRSGRFQVERDITEGRLVPVLERFNPRDIETIHAVFAGHGHLAARIRAFIDFLADKARS